MFVILGLVILVAAVIIGVAGVFGNTGGGHQLAYQSFTVFGYHVTGSTGALFLSGIVVGAAAVIGLGLLLAGYGRTARRGRAARRRLDESRRRTEAISKDRDDLIVQRAADADGSDQPPAGAPGSTGSTGSHRRWRLFGHRPAHR
ncbi:hypothetical protein [Streptomyces malaysiense]|uniref:Lipopolysaccharide assembly protein A domain-containing protein n=1 Tax=Streptomyces malaysiense TaxID=1428626 RepID=A0A1J4Q162_9ACTN|nr:hypothetical protein [Streptomyces malaysiense]OIK26308.1 hypothetical protein VT52_017230 [Streptomyces malaysiense]